MGFPGGGFNLAMSGGGVKGIAYLGVFDMAERYGVRWGNIAGVSAGAMAGALAAAGYSAYGMWRELEKFDFKGSQMENIPKKVPVVARYLEYAKSKGTAAVKNVEGFLRRPASDDGQIKESGVSEGEDVPERKNVSASRGNILDNILTYSKYGCLLDGDVLEEWMYRTLIQRGIRTFGDLRYGAIDSLNPRGYRLRVTGVDLNRAKLVVIPDDMAFYGIDPDRFEVAKAIRISTCVPFAFKPVDIVKTENDRTQTFSLVDGGVFDRYPYWLLDGTKRPTLGFKLSGGEKKQFFSVDTALDVLKAMISAVQDIGVPHDNAVKPPAATGEINTTRVDYLDFNLAQTQKLYLFRAGQQTAYRLFQDYKFSSFLFPPFVL